MSKKLKKCAIMLAIVLAISTVSVANVSAEAEKMSGGEITYRITERFRAERYYIHIWDGLPDGEYLYKWQSKKSLMTISEDGATATYNVPEGYWNMMVLSNNRGNMTYDTVFNQNCIGDTFTTEVDTSLAPVDDPLEPIVVWDNNPDCGRHRKINVNRLIPEGHAYLPGESDNTLFKDFCDKYGPKEDGSCLWEEEHNYNNWEEAKATLASNLNLTEAPTEVPTEVPTEQVTEAPTEELTEKPTEVATEAPTEKATEAKTEAPTEKPTSTATSATTATSKATTANTNTAKGTVNTSQNSLLMALALTFVASLGVVFGVNKKRNSNL
ncbi:MAG: PT domain-containing protein [Acutalibacteraceae bacterium]|nr:PT domain-containing protein [Acutalibacteraceae bacterium]